MARATPSTGNWLIKLIALAGMLELVYLVTGNLFLNVAYIQQKLSSHFDHFKIEWSSGWTFLPGHLCLNNIKTGGRAPQGQWSILMSRGEFDLVLWRLFSRTIELQSSTMSGLTVTVNSKITGRPGATEGPRSAAPAARPEPLKPFGTISIPPPIEQNENVAGWAFTIRHADIAEINQIKIDSYTFTGHGGVQLNELTFGTDGSLALGRGALYMKSGNLMSGSQSIGTSLEGDIELRLERFVPGEQAGPATTAFVSGRIGLSGDLTSFGILNRYFSDSGWLRLNGRGSLNTHLLIEKGRLIEGSQLSITSPDLVVEVDGKNESGSYDQHRIRGAGTVKGDVSSRSGDSRTQLQVELKNIVMQTEPQEQLFLQGEAFHLLLTGPPVNFSKMSAEPVVRLQWHGAVMPDISLLNGYLPGEMPFRMHAGRARLNGYIDYADKVVSGMFELAGENVTGMLLQQPVNGKLELDLLIKQIDPGNRFLDLSGTRILMQAVSSSNETKPLETRISIDEAKLKMGPDFFRADKPDAPPLLSGVVRLEGSVANIDFINSFLKNLQGLEFSGNGRLNADLLLLDGQVSPGSKLRITSGNLSSRFLDFEATGSGMVTAQIEGEADAPVAKLDSSIRSFRLRRQGETVSYIRGNLFQITAVGRSFDSIQGLQDLDTSVRLIAAEIPDITVYNSYLPKNAGISIRSGKGTLAGEFRLNGGSGSGHLDMQAEGVEVNFRDQAIRGDLRINTRLADGNLKKMIFDASGTRLRIENGSLLSKNGTQAEEWWGQLDIKQGHMTWKRPLLLNAALNLQLRDSGLLVHLFAKQKKQWLNDLLTIKNVTGETRVLLNGKSILLRKVRITGEQLLVLADVHLREKKIQGGMYAGYGILGMGIELEDERRTLKLLKPRKWYDSFSKNFETGAP